MATNPRYFRNGIDATNLGGTGSTITNELSRSVERVSWIDASNYCALRTQQERAGGLIPTDYVYRLPTASEREYGWWAVAATGTSPPGTAGRRTATPSARTTGTSTSASGFC